MKFKSPLLLQTIVEKLKADFKGDVDSLSKIIYQLQSLENAQNGDISFFSNKNYKKHLISTKATAVVISLQDAALCPALVAKIIVTDVRLALVQLASLCQDTNDIEWGINERALIGRDCNIAKKSSIAANCVIGNDVFIGEGVIIEPGVVIGNNCIINQNTKIKANVTIYDNVKMGSDCIIHSNSVIGSDGFGYASDNGKWIKMPHLGGVTIGDEVEIGSNTSIDRGFIADTVIGNNVIIDNQVQIAHNVEIGDKTAIAGCVGIAGSTKIGSYCLIGGGVSIAGHIEIADKVHITATSSVNRSIIKSGIYSSGLPVKENHIWLRNVARFQLLDNLAKRVRNLEQIIKTANL